MRRTAFLAFAFAAITISAVPAPGCAEPPAAPPLLENPAGFDQMFLWSFQLDACGETQSGDALRKALYEKVESCPFTDSAKEQFRKWRGVETAMKEDIRRKIEKRRELAEAPPAESPCETMKQSPGFKRYIDHLHQYTEGRIGFDTVISERCDRLPNDR